MVQGTTKKYPGWRDIFGLGAPGIDIEGKVKDKLNRPRAPSIEQAGAANAPVPLPQPTYKPSRGLRADPLRAPIPEGTETRYPKDYAGNVDPSTGQRLPEGEFIANGRRGQLNDFATGSYIDMRGTGTGINDGFGSARNRIANIRGQLANNPTTETPMSQITDPYERTLALRGKMMEQGRDNSFLSRNPINEGYNDLAMLQNATGMGPRAFDRMNYEEDRDAYYNHAERMAQMDNRGRSMPQVEETGGVPRNFKNMSWQDQNAIMNDPNRAAGIRSAKARNEIIAKMAGRDTGGGAVGMPYPGYQPEGTQTPNYGSDKAVNAALEAQQAAQRDSMLAAITGAGVSQKQAKLILDNIEKVRTKKPDPNNPLETIETDEFYSKEIGEDGKPIMRKVPMGSKKDKDKEEFLNRLGVHVDNYGGK